jgi:ribonuclease HI
MTERGTSAGEGSGPKTRYHLLTTDGGIVADQPGKAAGEAAIGVVLKAPLEEISEPIGPAKDHHVAEYRALIRGLEAARSRGIGHLRVCLDSALLVNQLNGRWKVKAEHLKPLHKQAVSLKEQFADIKITWVPRKANAEADALASTPLGPLRPETFNRRTSARIAPSLRSSAQPVWSTSRPLPTSPERALDRQSDLVLAVSDPQPLRNPGGARRARALSR